MATAKQLQALRKKYHLGEYRKGYKPAATPKGRSAQISRANKAAIKHLTPHLMKQRHSTPVKLGQADSFFLKLNTYTPQLPVIGQSIGYASSSSSASYGYPQSSSSSSGS